MNPFSEDKLIEQTAIKIFGEIWPADAKALAGKGAENFANAYSGETKRCIDYTGRENTIQENTGFYT